MEQVVESIQTNEVMEYILLRQHVSAPVVGHHQVSQYFKGDYTV